MRVASITAVALAVSACGSPAPDTSQSFTLRAPIAEPQGPLMPNIADVPEALASAPRYLPLRGWVRLPPGAALSDHAAWLQRYGAGTSEPCVMARFDAGYFSNPNGPSFAYIVIDPPAQSACVDDEGYWRAGRYGLDIGTVASDGRVGIGQAIFALTN